MNFKSLFVLLTIGNSFTAFAKASPTTPPPVAAESPSALSSPTSAAPDAAELTQLLKDFLAGASRNDVAVHERFWADDVIYTSSLGKRRGKTDILADVTKQSASGTREAQPTFSAEEIRIQQYGTTAILAFQLVATTTKPDKTEVAHYLNTGTFLKRNGKWQVVAWQATKIPTEEEPKK
jgi:ketosteroid isomerase-like protein